MPHHRRSTKQKLIKLAITAGVFILFVAYVGVKRKLFGRKSHKHVNVSESNGRRTVGEDSFQEIVDIYSNTHVVGSYDPKKSFVGVGDEDDNSFLCNQIIYYEGDKCEYARRECPKPFGGGIFNFLKMHFCGLRWLPDWLFYIFAFLVLFYLFYLLGDIADSEFCPALGELSDYFNLSEDVAGCTFLAIGNGAPDIASIFVSVVTVGSSGLGVGEPLGAGMCITTLVFGAVCLFSDLQLPALRFFREIFFYLISVVFVLISVITNNTIELWEAILYLLLYLGYVLVVICGGMLSRFIRKIVRKKAKEREEDEEEVDVKKDEVSKPLEGKKGGEEEEKPSSSDDDEEGEVKYTEKSALLGAPSINLEKGDVRDKKTHSRAQDIISLTKSWDKQSFTEMFVEEYIKDTTEDEVVFEVDTKETVTAKKVLMWPLKFLAEELHWSDKSTLDKIVFVVNGPMNILRLLTVPRSAKEEWSKFFTMLSCFFGIYFGVLCITLDPLVMWGPVPMMPILLALGGVISFLVLITTKRSRPPVFHWVFIIISFIMAIIWIYVVANELVNLLETLGILFHLSESLIGVTVLSWGNSLGDLFADTAMARKGRSHMAVTAVFAGPSLNLLIGLGISVTVACIKEKKFSFSLGENYDVMLIVTFVIIFMSLLTSLIIVPLTRFKVTKVHGVFLIFMYVFFICIGVLVESGVLFPLI